MFELRRWALLLGLACMVSMGPCRWAVADESSGKFEVLAYTEDSPPFNFPGPNGPAGMSVDVLLKACERLHWRCDIVIEPWARDLKSVQNLPNALLFTTARTPEREKDYIWVGPLWPREIWMFGRPGCAAAPNEWPNLRLGTVPKDATASTLIAAGYPQDHFDFAPEASSNYRKYAAGHVDCIAGNEWLMLWGFKSLNLGEPPPRRRLLLTGGSYYLALNPRFDSQRAAALQSALDQLRMEGYFRQAQERYLGANALGRDGKS